MKQQPALKGFLVLLLFERFAWYSFLIALTFFLSDSLNLSNTEVYQPYGTFLWIVVLSPLLIAFIADKYGTLLCFNGGILLTVVGYLTLPLFTGIFQNPAMNVTLPLLLISLGAGTSRVMIPLQIGLNSQIEGSNKKTYLNFVWYGLLVILGGFLANKLTPSHADAINPDKIIFISGGVLALGYVIWFISNLKNKPFKKNRLIPEKSFKNHNRSFLLIIILSTSLLSWIILSFAQSFSLNELFKSSYNNHSSITIYKMLALLIFGLILLKAKPLSNNKLIKIFKYGLLLLMALLVLMLLDQFIIKGFMNQQSYEIIHILNIIPYTITTTLLLYFVFDNAPPDRKGFYLGLYVFFVFFASTLSNYMIQVNKSTTLIIFIGSIIIIGLIQLFLHKKPANISKKH
ncbi:MAG: MFS transporter [Bacteroidales bacterium]